MKFPPAQNLFNRILEKFNPAKQEFIFTKTQFLQGNKCDLYLWNLFHKPEVIDSEESGDHFKFRNNQQNIELFAFGRELFPNGIFAPENFDPKTVTNNILTLLKERKPVYHSTLIAKNLQTKIDVLNPVGEDSWDIILFRNSGHKKPESILDISFQKYVADLSGIKISQCILYTVNQNYFYTDEIIVENYFKEYNVTNEVKNILTNISKDIEYFLNVRNLEHRPLPTKEHSCGMLKECRSRTACWKGFSGGNIHILREAGELPKTLLKSGVRIIEDIPPETELSSIQKIQIKAHIEGIPNINKPNLKEFIDKVSYPIHFLDFETINPVIPIYKKSYPFEHIPFLYSLDILQENGEVKNYTYIEEDGIDPREGILKNLKSLISSTGSIVCFNDMIEKGCLKAAVKQFSEYGEWFSLLSSRFVDASIPFRNLDYYHPDQNGSASLKSIVGPLINMDYKNLKIHDGSAANAEFLKFKLGRVREDKKEILFQNLIEYCRMDTFTLMKLFLRLKELINI
jgi:hypothetical protein